MYLAREGFLFSVDNHNDDAYNVYTCSYMWLVCCSI